MNSAANPTSQPRFRLQRETVDVIFILLAFVLVNMAVATRTPTVYCDEPGYADPAANLYLGSGFTSTLWGQDRNDFWCGNVPLYQGILFCFFKVFGFGLFQARMADTVLTAAGGFLIWAALRRTAFIRQSGNRLVCLALILSGSVSVLTFRTVRYDSTMFFICASVFFACCLPEKWRGRFILIGLFSALLPAAGVPMLPYTGLMILITLAVYGFANFGALASIAAGLLAGLAALAAFYSHFSSLRSFAGNILPFTAIGGSSHQSGAFLHAKIFGQLPGDDTLFTCFFGNPAEFLNQKTLFDYSAALLFLLVVFIALKTWRSTDNSGRKFIVFIFATTLIIPPIMHFAGHYRSYYRWMTYIPLAIAVPRLLEIQAAAASRFLQRLTFSIICLSLFMGIPARTLAILPHWSERSTAPIEQAVAAVARPSDVAVCNYKIYFALRPRVKLLYCYGLPAAGDFKNTKNLPVNEISLLCLLPDEVEPVTQAVGGKWKKVPPDEIPGAAALARTRYAVDFYRRDSN